jgi:hypothetical protein
MEEKNKMTNGMIYEGGAARSAKYGRYRDVPYALISRIAETFHTGAEKYEKPEFGWFPFEKNWKRGNLNFALDCLDHALRHLILYSETIIARLNEQELDPALYDTGDDHLANCGANLAMLAWFEEQGMFEKNKLSNLLQESSSKEMPQEPEPEPEPRSSVATKILEAFKLV